MLHAAVLVLLITPLTGTALQRREASQHLPTAWAALREHRLNEALALFRQSATADSRDPESHFGAGVAAYMLGMNVEARSWLEKALRLQPRFPEASVLLAEVLYGAGDVKQAVAVLENGLAQTPDHATLRARLAEWRHESQLQDRFYRAQGAHFTVLFEGPADEALARRAVEMLEAAYWRIGSMLNAYPSQPVMVLLYTREQFRDVTRAPEWSAGIYDGRIKVPMRGALDRPAELERVLAHEFVHALVDSLAGSAVPVWLNEGLATVLEPRGREFADTLLRETTDRLPPAALHQSFASLPGATVSLAYAQSAAAVQRILDLRGAPSLVGLLKAMGRGAPFDAAFQQHVYMRYEDFQTGLR